MTLGYWSTGARPCQHLMFCSADLPSTHSWVFPVSIGTVCDVLVSFPNP
jgi:hypothetical protein